MTPEERFAQKFLWIRPRSGGVNLSCGMAGETDLSAEEVREVIARLRDAIGDPDPQAEIERLRQVVGYGSWEAQAKGHRAEAERLQARIDEHVAQWDRRAAEYEAEAERLRAALKRAHDALDTFHDHTPETWEDRQRERGSA